jgi:hypothetical protein
VLQKEQDMENKSITFKKDEFGDNIIRTVLLLHEAVSLNHTKETKELINLLVRDLRDFTKSNLKESSNPYIKTLQDLKLGHLLNLCGNCLEDRVGNIKMILQNEYLYFFDTGVCKCCNMTSDVFVGYREDLEIVIKK